MTINKYNVAASYHGAVARYDDDGRLLLRCRRQQCQVNTNPGARAPRPPPLAHCDGRADSEQTSLQRGCRHTAQASSSSSRPAVHVVAEDENLFVCSRHSWALGFRAFAGAKDQSHLGQGNGVTQEGHGTSDVRAFLLHPHWTGSDSSRGAHVHLERGIPMWILSPGGGSSVHRLDGTRKLGRKSSSQS